MPNLTFSDESAIKGYDDGKKSAEADGYYYHHTNVKIRESYRMGFNQARTDISTRTLVHSIFGGL